jgi:hypothetical protein
MALYRLASGPSGPLIQRTTDNLSIPADLANVDYLAYQDWITAGGVTDPIVPDTAQVTALKAIVAQDMVIFRALELLIDVLLAKGTIAATDFPVAVRTLYLARKSLRVTAGLP